MNLYHIAAKDVPAVWADVQEMLAAGLAKGQDELGIGQLRMMLVNGAAELLVGRDEAVRFALAVEFQDFPNYRVAHVISMGGRDSLRDGTFEQFRAWAKQRGCVKAQAWCGEGMERLLRRRGFTAAYQVMRSDL